MLGNFTVFPIDVPTWNILRFAFLALVVDVLIAGRLRLVWAKYNGQRAMNAKRVRLTAAAGTRLGPSQEIDGNSTASRVVALLITAILLSASLLVEYGSSEGLSGSKRDCLVGSLHSMDTHPRLMIDISEIRYNAGDESAISLGGVTNEIVNLPPAPDSREENNISTFLSVAESEGRCPGVDQSVVRFKHRDERTDEVQIVQGGEGELKLQRQIGFVEKEDYDYVLIRSLPFVWNELCVKEGDVAIPPVDEAFVSLLWQALIKSAEGFSGVSGLPFTHAEEKSQRTKATLIFGSEGGSLKIRNEKELLEFLKQLIGHSSKLAITVSIDGLQGLSTDMALRLPEAFPTRDAVEFVLMPDEERFNVTGTGPIERTSAAILSQGKFVGITEISGQEESGIEYTCMLGNPWTACAKYHNESGVVIGIGKSHGATMTFLSLSPFSAGFSRTKVGNSTLRESLFNYVVLSSIKPDVELGPRSKYAITRDPKSPQYNWGGSNLLIPAARAPLESAECRSVKTTAAVNGLFYLGCGLVVGLYGCLLIVGYFLRKNVPIDIQRTLARTQNELLGLEEAYRFDHHERIRDVGIFKPDWSEGELHLGTLSPGIKAESAKHVDVVRAASSRQGGTAGNGEGSSYCIDVGSLTSDTEAKDHR